MERNTTKYPVYPNRRSRITSWWLLVFGLIMVAGCGETASIPQGKITNQTLSMSGRAVLHALKHQDYPTLQKLISEKGLYLVPYSFVDTAAQQHIPKKEFLDRVQTDTSRYHWGSYDGSGDDILLTWGQYYQEFVFDLDFTRPDTFAYNHFIGRGNTINNVAAMFPHAEFVESHFDSVDPQFDGMDWRSLILVFEKNKGRYWLIAIVHNEWTI